jgi:hypothetical protein
LADTLPIDLLQEKQAELATQLSQAERNLELAMHDGVELKKAIDEALDLAADCERLYAVADPQTRRQFNQALFNCFKVAPDGIEEAPLREEFAELLDPKLPTRLKAARSRNGRRVLSGSAVSLGRGSNNDPLAEREGFEPSRQLSPPTRFPVALLKPLGHLSGRPRG